MALGGPRDGVVYVPDTAETGAPVMVFLHGATGSGLAHMRPVLGAVDRYGVILVAPDSRSETTWDLIAERRFGPDVAFLDRALAQTFARYSVDPARVAVGGFSDGASYGLSLGIMNGDLFTHVLAYSPGFAVKVLPAGYVSSRPGAPTVLVETSPSITVT